MTFKARAQLLIAVIITVVSVVLTSYHISTERSHAAERSEHASKNVKLAFDSIIKDVEHYYLYRSIVTMRGDGVLKAMQVRDTENLYRLVYSRYIALREENPHLIIMQFHGSDGRSILRMHRKEQFGDNIAARRAMLREVHRTHKMVSGFEGGLEGVAYRIVVPIRQNGAYIGALEFGVDTDYFIQKIKQASGSDGVLMIHEDFLGAANGNAYKEGFGKYRYTAARVEQRELMALYSQQNPMMDARNIRYKGKDYEINPLFLKDTRGHNAGVIICINDISGGYENTLQMVFESFMITVLLIAVIFGIFEYAFAYLFNKLNLQERYIHTILDSQKNIVVVTDGAEIIYANQAFFEYLRYPSLEKFRQEHACICEYFETGESDEYLQSDMDGVLWTDYLIRHNTKEHKVKMTMQDKVSIFTVHSQKMQYQDQIRHVVVFTDITKLNELATQDPLTHIANRFQFDKVLEHSIRIATRYGQPLSMLLIDIDHFKQVNDQYGHLVGDEVLKQIAALLSQNIRESDIVARWGGEEFVILLPDCKLSSALILAEALRTRVESDNFTPLERVTCSVGVVQWRLEDSPDALLKRVDEKLYEAKEGGRNKVVS
jgi:diguanylate cyclase